MQNKRILFINFGGLGDEILFLPTIQSVKKEYPNSFIALALEERSNGITHLTDIIDETLFANIKGKNKTLVPQTLTNQTSLIASSGLVL